MEENLSKDKANDILNEWLSKADQNTEIADVELKQYYDI